MSKNLPGRPDVLGAWAALGDSPSSAAPGRRERVVQSIARTIHESGGHRSSPKGWMSKALAGISGQTASRYRTGGVAFALAAAAGLVLVVALRLTHRADEAPVARLYALVGASRALVEGHVLPSPAASMPLSLPADAEVETGPASTSRLQLVSGVEVAVGSETRLRLPGARRASSASEEMAIERGAIRVEVPKLRSGASFAIRTPNTLVVVHGTSFSVEVSKASPASLPRTKVVVTEGIVTVQQGSRSVLLGAGMEWASEGPPDANGGSSLAEPVAPGSPVVELPQGADTAARSGSAGQTELATQNRLFAQAMKAKERGDSARAIRLLGDFFRRFPDAPLAQDARVEQFRLLAAMGSRGAAVRAGRVYLSLYPNGFAHDEARRIVTEAGDDATRSAAQQPR
ncbi:MAG: FecR domain-containing protein [Myxococcota bacterium]|nr:FecR domain-containing protein [Myxococcota bacterium]